MKTGLVSISFRSLEPVEIADMVSKAGLDAIEWGGDIHVPHGDIKKAQEAKVLCDDRGITCPSYGSYYKIGEYKEPEKVFKDVLDCAEILGSKIIRVWAGVIPSLESNDSHFRRIADELKRLCNWASLRDIGVALEFHANTLTDTADGTKKLLEYVNEGNLTTYWQPPVDRSPEDNLNDIEKLNGKISNIHVFTWKGRERLELMKGYQDWVRYLGKIGDNADRHCLLEFVMNDSPGIFLKDAVTLKTLVGLF